MLKNDEMKELLSILKAVMLEDEASLKKLETREKAYDIAITLHKSTNDRAEKAAMDVLGSDPSRYKIQAIKAYRGASGSSLQDAKEAVDKLIAERPWAKLPSSS